VLARSSLEKRDRRRRLAFGACLRGNSYPHSLIDAGGTEAKPLSSASAECGGRFADPDLSERDSAAPAERCRSGGRAGESFPISSLERRYDVIVVGAGPAGLAVAVYAASEGLSVLVVDSRSFVAKRAHPRGSRNYLGFPTGISGQALTARAFLQAQKFGAQFAVPVSVVELDCSQPPLHRVALDNGVSNLWTDGCIASGARYRRPEIENLDRFEATSVSYWATTIEATLCEGRDIVLVGGGNSAGQAAVFLAAHARQVHLACPLVGPRCLHVPLPDRQDQGDPQYRLASPHRRHRIVGYGRWYTGKHRHDLP